VCSLLPSARPLLYSPLRKLLHPLSMSDVLCYWEKQGADKLCAVHCVNALMQGPYFSEVDLAKHAHELDAAENALLQGANTESTNVDASGNFSIGVIEASLKTRGFRCVNTQHPDVAATIRENPGGEAGYICNSHAREHWFTIRRVKGRWWDLDSLKHAPQGIGDVYLAEFLNATREQGFTIFVVRGTGYLPDPTPGNFTGRLQSHQHFLNDSKIEALKKQGLEKEQREAEEAQRVGGGDGAGSDEPAGPSFTKIAPADRRQPQETDWESLGGGQRLDGGSGAGAPGAAGAVSSTTDDAELQAALRASMMDSGAGGHGGVEPPEEPVAGTPGLCTVQVRLPSGKRAQRRFLREEHSLAQLFAWLERASAEDASLGLPVLTACESYSLTKRGFPGGQVKIERLAGAAKIGGEEADAKTLKECGFESQEALMLQL